MPFLTRQIAPVEFGLYQLAFTIGILVQPFLTLRLDSVIPSEADENAIHQYLKLIKKATITVAILWAAVIAAAKLFEQDMIASVTIMTGIVAASYAATAIDNALLIRAKSMRRLAVRNLLTGVIVGVLQVAFAIAFQDVLLIAVAILLGRFIAIGVTRFGYKPQWKTTGDLRPFQFDWVRTGYRIFGDLVSTFSINSMVLYAQFAFGPAATAFVGTAQRSASAPLGLISQALSQSVQADIGEAVRQNNRTLLVLIHRQMRSLLPYALMTSVGLIILGPLLAVPIFGSGWETTGTVIALLGIPSGLQLLVAPVSVVFIMMGAERRWFWVQVVRLLASLILAAIAQLATGDLIYAIAGFSLGISVSYVYMYLILRLTVVRHLASVAHSA